MSAVGPVAVGQVPIGGYFVLANKVASSYKPGGVTIDSSAIAAETTPRTLPGGFTTSIGDKVVPAGTVLMKNTTGDTSKYRPALTADTLLPGRCYILDRHVSLTLDADQVGEVFDVGAAMEARVLSGGAAQSLANIKTAFPSVRWVI